MSLRTRGRIGWIGSALLPLAACAAPTTPEVDIAGTGSGAAALATVDPRPPPRPAAELELTAGRLNKVPVQYAFHGRFTAPSGAQTVYVRANCAALGQPADVCNPGIVVARSDGAGALAQVVQVSNGGDGLGALYAVSVTGPQTFDVVVYSEFRGTSIVDLQWDAVTSGSPTYPSSRKWTDVDTGGTGLTIAGKVVGGTLIRLGPTPSGTVSVATPDDGAGHDRTNMWVFNPNRTQFARVAPLSGDLDPSLQLGSAWGYASGLSESFALIGLKSGSLTGLQAEQFVQVSLSPTSVDNPVNFSWSSCVGTSGQLDCPNGASPTTLTPGRYLVSVWAEPGAHAVASLTDGPRPASEMCVRDPALGVEVDLAYLSCKDRCGSGPYPERGEGNDLAFEVDVTRVDGTPSVVKRYVPRGVLGAANGTFNRITLDVVVPADAASHDYRVEIKTVHDHIVVKNQWAYRPNPEAVELKVATANVDYYGQLQDGPEGTATMYNVADFLGRGVELPAGSSNTQYRDNRSAWRWEADVVGFNEIDNATGADLMLNRLNGFSNTSWVRALGAGIYDGLANDWRYNPVYANAMVAKNGASLTWPNLDHPPAGMADDCDDNECLIRHAAYEHTITHDYYMVPATVRAPQSFLRDVTKQAFVKDIPIPVFQAYFPSDLEVDFLGVNVLSEGHMGDRQGAIANIVGTIRNLIDRPEYDGYFSPTGAPSRLNPGNRFIVMGDTNMKNHRCGEGNELLRALRDNFGYAIDVSQAFVGPDNRVADMHYSATPLTDPNAGKYGSCFSQGQPLAAGCPWNLLDTALWHAETPDLVKYDTSATQPHDWWNGPNTHDGGSSNRLDAIYLVGLGWANDDPVRDYRTITNKTNTPSRMNGGVKGAIEVRAGCTEEGGAQGQVALGDGSYFPEFVVCTNENGGLAGEGTTAWRSDHKPIGARLRLLPDAFSTLSVGKTGLGGGTITGPNGINCGSTCSSSFVQGQTYVLTASGGSSGAFHSWTGCDSVTGASCTVTMSTMERSISARFDPVVAFSDLYVSKTSTSTGTGTITSSPAGISCGATCYAPMTGTVVLTATPSADSFLKGWTGAGTGSSTRSVICNGGVASTSAELELKPVLAVNVLRTVTPGFTASGTYVTVSTPSGSCNPTGAGGACNYTYANDTTSVTLTAAGASSIDCTEFKGWSGACTNTTGPCIVPMTVARSVSAGFGKKAGCIPK